MVKSFSDLTLSLPLYANNRIYQEFFSPSLSFYPLYFMQIPRSLFVVHSLYFHANANINTKFGLDLMPVNAK